MIVHSALGGVANMRDILSRVTCMLNVLIPTTHWPLKIQDFLFMYETNQTRDFLLIIGTYLGQPKPEDFFRYFN